MPTLAEVRQQFPQYDGVSDAQLADGLYQKFYADKMPREQFDQSLGAAPMNPAEAAAAENRKYATDTIGNIPHSAAEFAKNTIQPIIHPIETAENIGKIGKGVLQKFGIVSGDDHEQYADAVGKFFADRYGGWENVKKTLKDDPVGTLADLSAVLSLGGSAAARLPGAAGEVGNVVNQVGRTVDPLLAAGKAVKGAANVGAEVVGGLTGTGGKSLRLAAEAGAEGGQKARDFLDNMNGSASPAQAVTEAKSAVAQLRADRGAVYRDGMDSIKRGDSALGIENQVLDFNKVDEAIAKVAGVKNFKGQDLSPTTKDLRASMIAAVDEWKALPKADFHTVEGLDALKQKLGDIRDGTLPNTPERLVADQVYQAVRKTIIDQAPEYAKVMKGYEEASALVKEIENTLSLKKSANIDTSLRKLQSILRNNVNTNYGNRAALADYLVSAGAPNLLTKLAGQSLSSWLPRGLGTAVAGGEALTLPALAVTSPSAAGALAATLPLTSPRLMGNVAFGAGAVTRAPLRPLGQGMFQAGRDTLQ